MSCTTKTPRDALASRFPDAVTAAVAARFGLADAATIQPPDVTITDELRDHLGADDGRVIALTGPSGSGKTMMLALLADIARGSDQRVVDFDSIRINDAVTPAKQVATRQRSRSENVERTIDRLLPLLARCGLAEAHLLVRPAATLSQGERFRLQLALALARKPDVLLIDEFGAVLDDLVASAIAASLRKLATALGITIIVAAPRAGFIADLQPDHHLQFRLNAAPRVAPPERRRGRSALMRQLTVERGTRQHWPPFARWHYRSHTLGVTSDIFVLRHRALDEPIGIAVYAYAQFHSRQRNEFLDANRNALQVPPRRADGDHPLRAWNEWFNRSVRCLHRIVIDPRFRGCGLGGWFTRRTIEHLNVPLVECFTSLGSYCGFLEAAGFIRSARADRDPAVADLERIARHHGMSDDHLRDTASIRAWYAALPAAAQQEVDAVMRRVWTACLLCRSRYRYTDYEPGMTTLGARGLRELLLTRDMRPVYFARATSDALNATLRAPDTRPVSTETDECD